MDVSSRSSPTSLSRVKLRRGILSTALFSVATRASPMRVPEMKATALAHIAMVPVTNPRPVSLLSIMSHLRLSVHERKDSIRGDAISRSLHGGRVSYLAMEAMRELSNLRKHTPLQFCSLFESGALQVLFGRHRCTLKRRCFMASTEHRLFEVRSSNCRSPDMQRRYGQTRDWKGCSTV